MTGKETKKLFCVCTSGCYSVIKKKTILLIWFRVEGVRLRDMLHHLGLLGKWLHNGLPRKLQLCSGSCLLMPRMALWLNITDAVFRILLL